MSFTQEQIRALDTVRGRLEQFQMTLLRLSKDLSARDPLPPWDQMASFQAQISFALTQINEVMTTNADILKSAHIYPHSTFPGHNADNILTALLRKKLDVKGKEWIEEYTDDFKADRDGLPRHELESLWSWASGCSQGIVRPMLENDNFGDDFTLAEREEGVENVRTGLKRKLWEEESGDEGEDGEQMEEDTMPGKEALGKDEGVNPELKPLPMESVLRFMSTGAMPVQPNR